MEMIECTPMRARISKNACIRNQGLARQSLAQLRGRKGHRCYKTRPYRTVTDSDLLIAGQEYLRSCSVCGYNKVGVDKVEVDMLLKDQAWALLKSIASFADGHQGNKANNNEEE